jgi:hypothetical protein
VRKSIIVRSLKATYKRKIRTKAIMEDGDAENRKLWELTTAEPLKDIDKEKRKMKGL